MCHHGQYYSMVRLAYCIFLSRKLAVLLSCLTNDNSVGFRLVNDLRVSREVVYLI
jgi:hypothetical protein